MWRSTNSACDRRPRAPPSPARLAARRGSVPARTPVPGRIHRLLAERARRGTAGDGLGAPRRQGPHLGAGGVDAGDVAVVVAVVVGVDGLGDGLVVVVVG